MIQEYSASNIKPFDATKPIRLHSDFIPLMDAMNEEAKKLNIIVWVMSSFRISIIVPGAIVKPAAMSNHLVGHAIDCNLELDGIWYNHTALENVSGDILDFIEKCEAIGLRWGGRFKKRDSVHFDDGINIRHPEKYKELLISLNKK